MDSSFGLIGAFVVLWYLVYGKNSNLFGSRSSHSCQHCNHRQSGNIWEEVRGTEYQPVHPSDINDRHDVYGNGFLNDPTPRQLGFSTGIISGRPCTPHQAVAEIQLLQFRRVFGRNPDGNEISPGVWQWQTDGGGTRTTNTRDGS